MFRAFPLVLGSVLILLLPVSAFMAEPPKDHEEWHGSLGALWIQYPFDCAVWNEKGKHIFQCHDNDNAVTLTIHSPSSDPFLFLEGTVLGHAGEVRAVKKGNTLTIAGTYDDRSPSLPLTIGGPAENFTFSGTYDGTPFQGKGVYTQDTIRVSLSFMKYVPITGTLELRRTDNVLPSSSPSSSPLVAFSANAGTPLVTSGSTVEIPPVPLLSSGAIEMTTRHMIDGVQDAGQAFTGFSRVLTMIFQTIFAVLAILLLVTFGFLLHHMKNQRARGDTPK